MEAVLAEKEREMNEMLNAALAAKDIEMKAAVTAAEAEVALSRWTNYKERRC